MPTIVKRRQGGYLRPVRTGRRHARGRVTVGVQLSLFEDVPEDPRAAADLRRWSGADLDAHEQGTTVRTPDGLRRCKLTFVTYFDGRFGCEPIR